MAFIMMHPAILAWGAMCTEVLNQWLVGTGSQ